MVMRPRKCGENFNRDSSLRYASFRMTRFVMLGMAKVGIRLAAGDPLKKVLRLVNS